MATLEKMNFWLTGYDADEFDSGNPEAEVYIVDDEIYTRGEFDVLVRKFAEEHHLPTNKLDEKARRLFDLCVASECEVHPETLLEEALDDHTIWDDDEWDATK